MSKKITTKPFYNSSIPSDWEVKKLGECCLIKGEYGINAAAVEYSDELPTYIRITDIDDDGNYSAIKKVSVNDENSGSFILRKGDIVFARTGATVGKTYLYDERDGELVFAGFLIRFRPDENILLTEHLKNFTLTKSYWDWVKPISMRSGQPGINAEEYGLLKLPLPPLPEQKAIAHILSLMDTAINKNNLLIAKKEMQKKWLMQNLLTGKKRLKGFEKEKWETIMLRDAFKFIKSYSISREGLSKVNKENSIYCIHYGDIHAFYESEFLDFSIQQSVPQIIDDTQIVNEKDYLKDGDIIMADASEDYEGVGEVVEVVNLTNKVAVGGLHTIILRGNPDFIANGFRGYLFSSEAVRNVMRKMATGTSVYSVTKSTLQNLSLKIPDSLKEQVAITQVLQAADKEIQLLKAKTEKLRQQKKGMMQVLLTGKKRLKI